MSTNKKYSGHFTFSGYEQAAVVSCFALLPGSMILLDLNEKRTNEIVRFFGVAEPRENGTWRTPWVYLASPAGDDLEFDEDYTQIELSVMHLDGLDLVVEGTWTDSDGESLPFKGRLAPSGNSEE